MVDVIADCVYLFKIKMVRIAPMGAAAGARRFVVQRRVRSPVIVLFAPFVQLLAHLTHALELDPTQYLVAHRSVEAFYLPVLRRLPRTRKLERYSPLFAPLLHIPTPKFRPVVALYRLRSAVQTYQPVQRLRNIVAAETSRYLAAQAFTTVVVYHVQYPIAPLVLQNVVHKVHTPSLVYMFRFSAFYSVETAFLATASFAYLQMFLSVDSQKLLVVHIFTESADVVEQQPITPAVVFPGEFFYAFAQCLGATLFAVCKRASRYSD